MKGLVVRLSAIGDVVHTLPALAVLRLHGHEVGWVVEPAARPLLEGNPALGALTTVPSARTFRLAEARRAAAELKAHRYEVALDFQGLWKSALWARLSGAPRAIGYAGPARREPLSRAAAARDVRRRARRAPRDRQEPGASCARWVWRRWAAASFRCRVPSPPKRAWAPG